MYQAIEYPVSSKRQPKVFLCSRQASGVYNLLRLFYAQSPAFVLDVLFNNRSSFFASLRWYLTSTTSHLTGVCDVDTGLQVE